MTLLGLVCALLIGLALGLLGGGGSVLTVPVFTYVLGYPPKTAIAMTLPVVAVASSVGAIGHWRAGRVRLRMAVQLGSVAMLTAFAAARLASYVPSRAQMAFLGAVIVAAAVAMLRPPSRKTEDTLPPRPAWVIMLVGALVGVLTGLTGVGGGFVIVPALVVLARLGMKEAIGTSLLVIVMNTIAGFSGYLGTVAIDWPLLVPFTLVAVGGILAGTRLVGHIPTATLRHGFAVLLVVIGVLILWQSSAGA